MRVEDFRYEGRGGRSEVRARVVWEQSDRAPLDLRYDVDASPETLARTGGNPFLVACAVSARHRGERRLRIDAPVCPVLRDGVRSAMKLLSSWYGGVSELDVECPKGFRPIDRPADRAGMFLSGGVDSLHLLRANRGTFPLDHPLSVREAVFVPYATFPDVELDARARQVTLRQQRAVEAVARRAGLRLSVVETNAGALEPDFAFFVFQSHGACLLSAAHALTDRLGSVGLASSWEIPRAFLPYGSHPLLDPLYGSSGLDVTHEGLMRTRLERVEQVAAWDEVRDSLMVCFEGPLPPGQLNCGECEKCLRTMAGLFLAGALERFPVFGAARLDAEAIRRMPIGYHPQAFRHYWEPMARALRGRGHPELAREVERRIREAERLLDWLAERDWRGRLRRFDRRLFGGAVRRAVGRIRRALA